MKKIKVLIIDDSALVREVLQRIFSQDRELEVIGSVRDPFYAVKKIKEQKPDVITLDVEMPRMDGLSFLRKLMSSYPIPVLMVSSWTSTGGETTLKALELGAVDFVEKPSTGVMDGLEELKKDLIFKVKAAAKVDPVQLRGQARMGISATEEEKREGKEQSSLLKKTTDRLIAVGASTGGTTAIRSVVTQLPFDMLPVVVVLHMPQGFTASFARGLDSVSRMRVKEAEDGESLLRGHCYIAPGGRHLLLQRSGAQYYIKITDDPPYNHHRPSVDKTFFSVGESAGENAFGLIMTGMGSDGAAGLKEIYSRGGITAAQDEATSVVYGMPRRALELGAVGEVVSLNDVPSLFSRWANSVRE